MKTPPIFAVGTLQTFIYWIKEREAIRIKKEAGKPQPWTKDPILAMYRFCNVDRNDDTVTRWIREHWLLTYAADPDLWFAMVVARLLNLPASLGAVHGGVFEGGRVVWQPKYFLPVLDLRKQTMKIFNGAYIVSTNGHAMDKVEYITTRVLDPLWGARAAARPHVGDTLDDFHKRLMTYDGLGSFMAAQVVADVKYDKKGHLAGATDWATWAASGPGSRRGMNRLKGRTAEFGIREHIWREDMAVLYAYVHATAPKGVDLDKLTAQNLQNCLCEFDKYMRAYNKEGTPKQMYRPA